MKKYLISISIAFLFASCSVPYQKALKEYNGMPYGKEELERIFSPDELISAKYIVKVTAFGRDFSGLFIVRKTDSLSYRIVLLAHTGTTILAMQVSPEDYKILYAIEQIENKKFLDMLYNDMNAMLFLGKNPKPMLFNESQNKYDVIRICNKAGTFFCYVDSGGRKLVRIDRVDSEDASMSIRFIDGTENAEKSIMVEHFDYPIKIILERIADEQFDIKE